VLGIVFTAAFILWKVIQMLLLGAQNEAWIGTPDLKRGEVLMLVPLVAYMLLYGLYPKWILDYIHPASASLVTTMDTVLTAPAAADAAGAEAAAP